MLKRSTGSVTVIYLDRAAVRQATHEAVARLTRERPEVLRVILFGSVARGDAVPGSDVDLLVVLAHNDKPFLDRIALYKPEGVPLGVDVFPYTEGELDRMLAEGHSLVRQAMAEGIVLFERSEARASP